MEDAEFAVVQLAQTTMRSELGQLRSELGQLRSELGQLRSELV